MPVIAFGGTLSAVLVEAVGGWRVGWRAGVWPGGAVMAPFGDRPPNVLVLGGGGLLGEAWITGVLAGYEDATGADVRGCRRFVGTSAGSIVAASVVAAARHVGPGRPTPLRPPDPALTVSLTEHGPSEFAEVIPETGLGSWLGSLI